MWAHGLNMLLGVWLMFSPSVLGYEARASTVSYVIGPLVICMAYLALWPISNGMRWVNLILGLCLVIAPWIYSYSTPELVNSVATGITIMGFSLIKGPEPQGYAGGWSSLWRRQD